MPARWRGPSCSRVTPQVTAIVAIAVPNPATSERIARAVINLEAAPTMIGVLGPSRPALGRAVIAQLARQRRRILPVDEDRAARTGRQGGPNRRAEARCTRARGQRRAPHPGYDESLHNPSPRIN